MGAGGSLIEPDGPPGMGPFHLRDGDKGVLGNNTTRWVIPVGAAWQSPKPSEPIEQQSMRASILRGQHIFHFRTFSDLAIPCTSTRSAWAIPLKRTCSTCHGMHMTGMDHGERLDGHRHDEPALGKEAPRNPWQTEDELMPLFKITCSRSTLPHPYLGRVI